MTKQLPRMETLAPLTLVGMRRAMSRTDDRTSELWRTFGPREQEVTGRKSADSISIQVYAPCASGARAFRAVREVGGSRGGSRGMAQIPDGMECYRLGGGFYAVFTHHGPATDFSTFAYIFSEWLPRSGYELDHREHFEVLSQDYAPLDPKAREEIWVPVRAKGQPST